MATMEHTRPARHAGRPWTLRLAGVYLPLAFIGLGVFLVARQFADGGAPTPPSAAVAPGHREQLAADIAFFEGRVPETNDSLSYNRLVQLYLQRFREQGDPADISRAALASAKSVEVAPGNHNSLLARATALIARHDFEGGLAAAEEARRRAPNSPDALALIGDARFALGQYEEARASYERYLEQAPGPSAFARKAQLAELDGNVPVAIQFWEATIDSFRISAPADAAWARVQLGTLLLNTGNPGRARAEFELALEAFPGYPHAEVGLGRVAAANGNDAEAVRRLSSATAALPLPEAISELAAVLQRQGKTQEAEAQLSVLSAVRDLYEAAGIRDDLVLIRLDLDHGAYAAAALERARQAYAARPATTAADTLAWAEYHNGNLAAARKLSAEALRFGTRDPLMLFHAGVIAFASGDYAEAVRHLEAVKKLNPAFSVLHQREAAELLNMARERAR